MIQRLTLTFFCLGLMAITPAQSQPQWNFVTDIGELYGSRLNGASSGPVVNTNDGSVVAFRSFAGNLQEGLSGVHAPLVVKDLVTDQLKVVTSGPEIGRYALSPEGRHLAYVQGTTLWLLTRDSDIRLAVATVPGNTHVSVSSNAAVIIFESDQVASLIPTLPDNSDRQVVRWDRFTGTFSLVSVNASGNPGNDDSNAPMITSAGNKIAFISKASDLTPDDVNARADAFVVEEGVEMQMISRNGPQQTEVETTEISVSPNGRYAAFVSATKMLLPESASVDSNQAYTVNLQSGEIFLASTNEAGNTESGKDVTQPWVTSDGQTVYYALRSSIAVDVLKTRAFAQAFITPVNQFDDRINRKHAVGNFFSSTAEGDLLFYASDILRMNSNCGPLQPCVSFYPEIYSVNIPEITRTVVSTRPGAPLTALARGYVSGMSFSADGQFMGAQWRMPQEKVTAGVYLDRQELTYTQYSAGDPELSADGRYWAKVSQRRFANSYFYSFFWADHEGPTTQSVPAPLDFFPPIGKVPISLFGEKIFFDFLDRLTPTPNPQNRARQIYIYESSTMEISPAEMGLSMQPNLTDALVVCISADGRYLLFTTADNIPGIDTGGVAQLYLRDFETEQTTLISVDVNGSPTAVQTAVADISDDGQIIVIQTNEPDFIDSGATTAVPQTIYRLDQISNQVTRISPVINAECRKPQLSSDGRFTAFVCASDLYVHDATQDQLTLVIESDFSAIGVVVNNHRIPGEGMLFVDLTVSQFAGFEGLPGDMLSSRQVIEISLLDPFFDTVFKDDFE